jgi:uncharacterized protein (DUF433 family)
MENTFAYIEIRENRRGKPIPYIVGTRIRVSDVYVSSDYQGQTPDEIVASYPHLTLSQVHSALAYAFCHRDEIVQQLREEEEFVALMKARTGPGPLATKLGATNVGEDKVSR